MYPSLFASSIIYERLFFNGVAVIERDDKNIVLQGQKTVKLPQAHSAISLLKEEDAISGNSSFEDCLDIANTEINFGLCEIRNLEKKISSVKIEKTLFDSYTHEKRKKLTSIIKSSNSRKSLAG